MPYFAASRKTMQQYKLYYNYTQHYLVKEVQFPI